MASVGCDISVMLGRLPASSKDLLTFGGLGTLTLFMGVLVTLGLAEPSWLVERAISDIRKTVYLFVGASILEMTGIFVLIRALQ